jgi:alpha-glucosidase
VPGQVTDLPDPFVWWRDGVLYQIYPRSWADADGDGVGDLRGIIDRLDHLAWLGIDGVWLNPITSSPGDDWGYDVSEYLSVDPRLGTMGDLDQLVREADVRGIRIVLDLVPNHTSDRHPWFVESRSSRNSPKRDWYVWRYRRPNGSPPNNWLSVFGGPAWMFDPPTGQCYLHNFLPSMPDLNWWSEDVREAFDHVLRFWFERGVAGFRIDVAHGLVKDRSLRDNPPATEEDHLQVRRLGQRATYSMNRPEVHDVFRRWRAIASGFDPPRALIGETYVLDLERWATFYGRGDELDLAFNFPFVLSPFDAASLRRVVERSEALIPSGSWPVWTGSNHDVGRFPSRWCEGDEARTRLALLMLLTLRGTPFLYYGDEVGMGEVEVPFERLRDPVGRRRWPHDRGRDGARSPMQWEPGAGFTAPHVEPWLPLGDHEARNVEEQRGDPGSMLWLCRDLIALRRRTPDLRAGAYRTVAAGPGTWAWRRGDRTMVGLNLSDRPVQVGGVEGTVLVGTDRARDGVSVRGRLSLAPWEGVVVATTGR